MLRSIVNRVRDLAAHKKQSAGTAVRKFRPRLEILEDRSTPAAIPTATLVGVPADPFIGENFSFTARFDNTSPTDAGFGPYLDLYLRATGTDGTGAAVDDGITFVSATYLGVPVTATTITLTAGGVPHPYAVNAAGAPLIITPPAGFQAGDQLVVLQLPFGSFTNTQPAADVLVTVATSNLADLNAPLPIRAQGGFRYGNDALANPATDPTIVGTAATQNVLPTLLRLTKTYVGPEDETATGPNFPRQYQINVDVATGQTVTNLDLTDALPNNLQFVSVNSTTVQGGSVATTSISTPSTSAPGGTLTRRFATVTGAAGANDATMVFTYYVPLNNLAAAPVINATTGDDATSIDDARTQGNWTPIDGRDPVSVATSDVTVNDHTLTDKSIAIQKGVAIVTDTGATGASPGDTLQYTLQFQVSDYFAFQNLVIDDLYSDGQDFVPGSLTLSVTDGHAGGTTAGAVNAANFTLTTNTVGGSDRLVTRVSDELITRAYSPNGRMVGGAIPNGGTGGPVPPSAPPLPFGPTTGTITFRTTIRDDFQVDFPSGDPSVDQGDRLTNNVTATGNLLNVSNLTPNGQSEADTSAAAVTIVSGQVSKSIYAINGNTAFGSNIVKPGDTVTYRITYTLPTSDEELLSLTDYLPLPVLVAGQVSGFDDVTSAAAPVAGRAKFGPTDTFRAYSGLVPTVSTNAGSNSVQFSYANFDSPTNQSTVVDILFTVTVSGEPFADGLFLTNQVRSSEGSTNQGISTQDSIVQIQLTEPVLNIRKGVVATNGTGGTFNPVGVGPAGVTFSAPGSATPFTGTISSNGLAANPINSNLSGIDAGDLTTFAIVVENTGNSANGAFDVRIRDTLPAGFVVPVGGLNLQVRDGTGAVIGFTTIGAGLFDAAGGIELTDPGSTNPDPGSIDRFNATNGRNIAIITYDLQVAPGASPTQSILNTATLTNFAGLEGGTDHTTVDPIDTATVQIRNVTPTKSIVATSEASTVETGDGSAANPRLTAVGEIVRYRLVVEVPEGTVTNAQIRDQLPNGLTFLNDGTTRVALVSDQSAFTSSNPAGATLSLALGSGPLGTQPFVSGNDTTINSITPTFVLPDVNIGSSNSTTTNSDTYNTGDDVFFKLGTIVNNDRDANREYVVIELNALVDNSTVGSNDAGDNRDNNFQFNTGATTLNTSGNIRTRVVEPSLTVTKAASPATGDAGDTVSYTVTITNPAGANATTAFETRVLDTLPAFLTLNTASVSVALGGGAAGVTNVSAGNTVDLTVGTLPAGGTITVTYTATINAGVIPGQAITNTANVTTSSLPGTNGTTVNPTGSSTPGVPGSNTGERNGNGTAPNDLLASAPATVTVVALSPVKSLVTTSEASTAGANATIGEVARYRMRVRIPESSALTNFQIQDALPPGLTFLNDGTATVALVSNGPGITSSTLSGAGLVVTGNEVNVGSITPTFAIPGASITGGPFVSGTDPTFNLGNLNNQDRDADQEFAVIEFNALVDNAGTTPANSNDGGDVLSNTFTVSVNGSVIGTPSNAVTVNVVEPQITNVNKTVNVANADAGDVVTYTVTFSNTGGATAFDAILADNLPAAVTLNPASITVTNTGTVTGVSTAGTAGNNLQVSFVSIAAGATVTITYQATLISTVAPGNIISNTAALTYTSLPGPNGTTVNPTGSATPGAAGTATGERNNAGGINDYTSSDPASLTVSNGAVTKAIVTTSQGSTLGNNVTIGEIVTYSLTVTLPEGAIPSINITDNIPPGAVYVTGSASINSTGFNGTLPAPIITNAGGSGDDVIFAFGATTVVGDNVAGNNSFTITYQTRVLNIPTNNGVTPPAQTTLPNTATVQIGTAPTLTSNTLTTTVVEPRMTIAKNIVQTTADAADTVTMTLTVQNTGTSTSFDTIVQDVLNTANFNPATVNFGAAGTQYPAGFTPTVNVATGEILYSGGTIAAGATATFTFTVQLTNTVTPGQTVPNSAQVTQATTIPGVDPNERNTPTGPASDSLVINTNGISGFVYVDANNNGVFNGGETPLVGVNITLTGTDHLGNPVSITIPTGAGGAYSFTGLRPGTYTLTEPTQPAAFQDGIDTPGTPFGGTALAPTGDQISAITIPLGGNTTGVNYNFGELPPASISNFVWEDANGNGLQDLGEVGLDGVAVTLTGTDVSGNAVSLNTTTAGGGLYAFNNLRPGNYQVTFGTLAGYVFTVQDSAVANDATDSDANRITGQTAAFALTPGQNDTTRDAGLYRRITVGDRLWYDVNADGIQDAGEPGIPGTTVTVSNAGPDGIFGNGDDIAYPPVLTGANGIWTVPNVDPGSLRATVSNLPSGLTATTFDLDGVGTPNVATFAGVSGTSRTDVDFGYRGTATLGDRVWNDNNGNGVQDPGEPGLPGVGVNLTWLGFDGVAGGGDDVTYTTTTNNAGIYGFANLPAGNFVVSTVAATVPSNLVETFDLDGFATPNTTTTTLTPGQNRTDVDFGYRGPASVGDTVWNDVDGNGVQNNNEPGIAGATVTLVWAGPNNVLGDADDVTYTTVTDTNGNYTFQGLPVGNAGGDNYRVTVVPPAQFTAPTFDLDGVVTPGQAAFVLGIAQNRTDVDFGYRGSIGTALGNRVFEDLNGNGIQDGSEPGIDGVAVTLYDAAGTNVLATTTTAGGGLYSFVGLTPGTYQVLFGNTAGATTYTRTPANIGANDAIDSDANTATGFSGPQTVTAGVFNDTVDAGLYRPESVGDRVWYDLDGNGAQDPGEPGIPGATVTLVNAGPDGIFGNADDIALPPVITGANGIWTVNNVPPGSVRATVSNLPNGLTAPTFDLDGTGTANSATFPVVSGTSRTDVDFGVRGVGSIGDRVWVDIARDGIDNGEPPLNGVTVNAIWAGFDGIAGNADDVNYSTVTDANGNYLFGNLPLGNFQVSVVTATLPPGYLPTYDLDSGLVNPNNTTAVTLTAVAPAVTTADFGYSGAGLIGDRVWVDVDGDGVQDPGELGLPGVTVTSTWAGPDGDLLTLGDNQVLTTTTGPTGAYSFINLPPGLYRVDVIGGLPPGVTNTGDPDAIKNGSHTLTLAQNEQRVDVDFGYQPNSSIAGYVYRDFSVDGIRQPAGTNPETGIGGITVTLTGIDIVGNNITRTTTTAADGSYSFGGLLAGNYTVLETQPPPVTVPGGFYDGLDRVGTINGVQTGTQPVKNQLQVNLGTGQNGIEYNFGENPPADPFGFVYVDLNNNGIREAGEPGIAGVAITVSGTAFAGTPLERPLTAADVPGGLVARTDANGRWEFPIIPPGVYTFIETQPAGYIDGREQNADPNGPNTVIVGNDRFDNVVLSPFPIRGPFNFGEIAGNGSVSGSVYVDTNNSGRREGNEVGIANVLIYIQGQTIAGTDVLRSTYTDAFGNYIFTGLLPGTYSLTEIQPGGYLDGLDAAGTNGGAAGNDVIFSLTLGANQAATLYTFGELGYTSTAVTKRGFLAR